MLKNLVAEKAIHRLSNQQMADILGVSRPTFESKMKSERFTVSECQRLLKYFNKTFEYLFATDDDQTA